MSGRSGCKGPPKSGKGNFEKQAKMFVFHAFGYKLYCLGSNIEVNYVSNL